MGALTFCLKCVLITINVLLGIIGIVLLSLGIVLKTTGSHYINKYAGNILEGIEQLSSKTFDESVTPSASPQLDFDFLLQSLALVLIVFGAVTVVLSFLGACGVCCASKCLLVTYVVLLIILLLAQIIVAILFFTKQFDKHIRDVAMTKLTDDYVDLDNFGVYSLAWNFIMIDFHCCGLDNYTDFNAARSWPRTRVITLNYGGHQRTETFNLTTPVACCKLTGNFPNVQLANDTCAIYPSDDISNWKTGCWNEVTDFLSQYSTYIIIAVTGLLIFQGLLLIIGLCIVCSFDKYQVSPH